MLHLCSDLCFAGETKRHALLEGYLGGEQADDVLANVGLCVATCQHCVDLQCAIGQIPESWPAHGSWKATLSRVLQECCGVSPEQMR